MQDMMLSRNSFYVTTPIYYVTAKPHIGSLYSTLIADVLARWHILQGKEVFFLTGTDEHGQKIAHAAQAAKNNPKAFVDSFIFAYKDIWSLYNIEYNRFIRTTEADHIMGAQHLVEHLLTTGDIYKDVYNGWYCTPCEAFVTSKDHVQPICPSCSRETNQVTEEAYFFKLSKYQDSLLQFYTMNSDFITPKERFHEVISFVESGLKDLSISRTTVQWGVPFPGDTKHTVYVWVEALANYISAIGYGQKDKQGLFNKWWPANIQVMGKDIVRFHAVYWPAILMAAGLALPKRMLVHGWITVNQQKMSKSLGNSIDPELLQKKYGADAVRYYLLRHIAINQDGDFSAIDLERCIESDLANDLGNLLNRVTSLAEKYGIVQVNPPSVWQPQSLRLRDECWNAIEEYGDYMQDGYFHMALARIWKCINAVNAYFHAQMPWKIAETDKIYFTEIIAVTCHSLWIIGILLWPVMPKKMEMLLSSLGVSIKFGTDIINSLDKNSWHQQFILKKIPTLFHKVEEEPKELMKFVHTEQSTAQEESYITIDDLIKVELAIGTIEQCETVGGSDKLYKMLVDFGVRGKRQILAGVRQFLAIEDLVNTQGTFVLNLKPRKLLGHESQGMMLVAKDAEGKTQQVRPMAIVPNGTRLQ